MGTIAKVTAGGATHLIASSAYGTCSTAAATVAKVATIQDSQAFTLIAGTTVHIYFTYSNTAASPTLNVNSTGALPIYKYGTTVPGKTAETSWSAGAVVSFTYNTTARSAGCWTMNDHIDNTDTNTKVTSVGNHYAPAEDTTAVLSADASSSTAATWNSTSLVTGVNIKRDAKGHVVGVTVDSIKMPANPNSNNAVTQTATDTANANYRVLFSATADDTTRTEGARKDKDLTYNPSTGNLAVTKINGVTVGSSPKFTDVNVTQTRIDIDDSENDQGFPIILAKSDAQAPNAITDTVNKSFSLTYNPYTSILHIGGHSSSGLTFGAIDFAQVGGGNLILRPVVVSTWE